MRTSKQKKRKVNPLVLFPVSSLMIYIDIALKPKWIPVICRRDYCISSRFFENYEPGEICSHLCPKIKAQKAVSFFRFVFLILYFVLFYLYFFLFWFVFRSKSDKEEKRKSNGHTLLWRYYFGRKRNCLREEVYFEVTFSKIRLDIEMWKLSHFSSFFTLVLLLLFYLFRPASV